MALLSNEDFFNPNKTLSTANIALGFRGKFDEANEWAVTSGLYKEGVVDGSFLVSLLEAHRGETACTFSIRRSCRESMQASATAVKESVDIFLSFLTIVVHFHLQAALGIVPLVIVAYTAMKQLT